MMKKLLILLFLGLSFSSGAQVYDTVTIDGMIFVVERNDSIVVYDGAILPGFRIPETRFRTIEEKKSITGTVERICSSEHTHMMGYTLGFFELKGSDSKTYNVVICFSDEVSFKVGEQVTVNVRPYSFQDSCFNGSGGFLCEGAQDETIVILEKANNE